MLKKNKGNPNWKKVILSLFAGEMILYIENPRDANKNLVEFINEFSKVVGYKINV